MRKLCSMRKSFLQLINYHSTKMHKGAYVTIQLLKIQQIGMLLYFIQL